MSPGLLGPAELLGWARLLGFGFDFGLRVGLTLFQAVGWSASTKKKTEAWRGSSPKLN